MSGWDPAVLDGVRLLASAVVAAVTAGVVSEWRTRAAEKRADVKEIARLQRDDLLRGIDDTLANYREQMDYLLARLVGTGAISPGADHPRGNFYLIGDEALITRVIDLQAELEARTPGSGPSANDIARLGAQRGHVAGALDVQRGRVLSGQEPIWPSRAFVRQILEREGDRYGVPPEHRPKVADPPADRNKPRKGVWGRRK
jgi:hypothetical protein